MPAPLKRNARLARLTGIVVGMLFVIAASEAHRLPGGFQYLHLSQLWKFQRMVRLIGLGLIAASTVGGHIAEWSFGRLEEWDRWILGGQRRASLLLAVLMLTYTALYGGFAFYRHYSFNSGGYDLAIQDQIVWNTAQGRPFASSIEVRNYLGDHVQPYLALLSLFYVAVPSPYVLLIVQTMVLALGAWPLYRLVWRKFHSPTIGLAFAFCYLAYPPLGFINRFDFHGEVIAIPLLIAAYERFDAKDLKGAAMCMGLALFAKEDTGLSVAALGLLIAFCYKRWRFGLAWTAIGTTYSLVALFLVIPAFRGGPSDTLARYQWLGNTPLEMVTTLVSRPGFVLQTIVEAGRITTSMQMLAPFAFLPLLGLPALLPAIPALSYNYLSQSFCQATIYCHYMVPVIPFMTLAGLWGLESLTTGVGARILGWIYPGQAQSARGIGIGLSLMLLATLASWTYENPITDNTVVPGATFFQANHAAILEGLMHIPQDAYLVTTNAYAPHLSHRRQARVLMYNQTFDPNAEAIFLNLRDSRWLMDCRAYRQYLESATRSGFGVTFYRDGVLLAQKGQGDYEQLQDLASQLHCN